MPQINLNVILSAVAYAALTGLLNLIFSKKSQINAWCEANPRLAAIGKLMRAVGFDPHGLWAFVTLLVTKKLPRVQLEGAPPSPDDTARISPIALLLFLGFAVHQQGCSSPPAKAPCDSQTAAQITALCSVEAYACAQRGGSESECTSECDAKLDARAAECHK